MKPLRRFLVPAIGSTAAVALLLPTGAAEAAHPPGVDGSSSAGTVVLHWNETMGRAAIAACIAPLDNPLQESRMYAMAQLAIHDALNAIDRRARSYAEPFRARRGADPRAAVAAAARDTLTSAIAEIPPPFDGCRPAATAVVEEFYEQELTAIPTGPSKARGVAAGQRAAAQLIALRAHDGSDTPLVVEDYPQGTAPGAWRFTPGVPFAFAPGWGGVTPFAITSADQFPAAGPMDLTSAQYVRNLSEVKRLGGDDVTTPSARTPEQTEIALFWRQSSPLMWNQVGRSLARSHHLDAWDQARMFGLLNAALADAYIASFAKKYDDPFWRPITAIREAANDSNPRTHPDPTWTPLRPTPPIPDHDSAHAAEGGAAAGVLTAFFGTDRLSFSLCSESIPDHGCSSATPTLRGFRSISAAASENAVSRVLIGFHFRHASEVGNRHGYKVGRWTANHIIAPTHAS